MTVNLVLSIMCTIRALLGLGTIYSILGLKMLVVAVDGFSKNPFQYIILP